MYKRQALAYAHSRGLVHRDIKPANLLFDEEGHASVADFGIARALAEASWTEPVGAMVGTARYAAPEQLRGFPLDGGADAVSYTHLDVYKRQPYDHEHLQHDLDYRCQRDYDDGLTAGGLTTTVTR